MKNLLLITLNNYESFKTLSSSIVSFLEQQRGIDSARIILKNKNSIIIAFDTDEQFDILSLRDLDICEELFFTESNFDPIYDFDDVDLVESVSYYNSSLELLTLEYSDLINRCLVMSNDKKDYYMNIMYKFALSDIADALLEKDVCSLDLSLSISLGLTLLNSQRALNVLVDVYMYLIS